MAANTHNQLETYRRTVVPTLTKEFGYTNVMAVPHITKVVLNVGYGSRSKDAKAQEVAVKTLERITGQKPIVTRSKRSISNFKVREGQAIGAMVTLRGARMYDFLTKLVNIALPRVRDFRGLPVTSVDSCGNLTIGVREHIVFPEIRSDEVEALHGLEVSIATTAGTREPGKRLFELLGFPFSKD